MKYLPLVLRNLLRRKVRTIFTVLSIFIAFVLFGVLMAIRAAFTLGVEVAGADRLMTIHKVSLIQLLPKSYAERIRTFEGVTDVSHANWFGALLPGAEQFPREHGSRARELAADVPEFKLPEDQAKAWIADRTGAIVGIDTAKKYKWKIGDRVPLISPIYRKPDGSPWEFTIDGIYDSPVKGTDKTQFFFHWDYINETFRKQEGLADQVGWYVVRVKIRPAPTASPRGSTRSSPTRRPRPRRRPRRSSSRTSPARSATSAAS